MFKGFGTKQEMFHGFPNLNFQMNNEAYGFSGCIRWWSADYGTNTVTDGASVSIWTDKIAGSSFIQDTAASQPLYVAADTNFNNYPSISYTTTGRHMHYASIPFEGGTIAVIVKVNSANNVNTILTDGITGSDHRLVMGGNTTGYTGIGVVGTTGSYYIGGNVEDTNSHIIVLNNNELWVDGSLDDSIEWHNTTNDWNSMGIISGSSGQNPLMRVAEIILWRGTPSPSDVSYNINLKYAIY